MGCFLSRQDINDVHSDTFSVINVDDQGNPTYEGHIKVTQQALELFKRGSQPVSWPLKSIRRYGKDAESKCFTFESGRRCPTGPGVYVFRCSRTQQLFERVQSYVRQNSETESVRRSSFGRIIEPDPPISPRNDVMPNSVSSLNQIPNGQNNQYVNMNLDSPQQQQQQNIQPPQKQSPPPILEIPISTAQYENVTVGAARNSISSPLTPPPILEDPFPEEDFEATNAKINYAQLELSSREANNNQNTAITAITSGDQPEVDKEDYTKSEANKRPRDYALIDFDRTQALSQAVRPLQREGQGAECAQELGIRKTRHNSTLESICTLQT